MAPVEIPANYYLNYFNQMIDLVLARYQDILPQQDLHFISQFKGLSEPAQRLLIRFYIRKGPLFLTDTLAYKEVPDIGQACAELCSSGLSEENPEVYCWQLVELLPVAESRSLLRADKKIRKSELLDQTYLDEEIKSCTDWGIKRPIIQPTGYETYRRLQLLYFGNEQQTLTEFILEDIGLFKYEPYPIDRDNRLFNKAKEVETTLLINDLAIEFAEMSLAKDWQQIEVLAEQVLKIQPGRLLLNRWSRLANRIAYRLEQLGELELAYRIFSTNHQPPSRERRTRILFKQQAYQAAKKLLEEIHQQPISEDETTFYRRFINKVHKPLGLATVKFAKPHISETHLQLARTDQRVEELACDQFPGAVWLENSLPLAVFGLVFWQVIFADKPGVWHHPFQSGPSDLYRSEFSEARSEEIASLFNRQAQWLEIIQTHWAAKHGIRNAFVHWSVLTADTIIHCYTAFHPDQWAELFRHLLLDIRNHRSGFPDLFQRQEQGGRFIEVKGPGDKLQDNQKQWLAVFERIGIPAEVCYIQYL
ncbi:VRR-NUC domain-containing protein [Reinekea marinisedimentorum]|uniref:phosphodiesterase I n=2 Tax=Reinekea marinisedimentorum TaxID=230495 RepID=A0A4R3ICD8_9GAMM|nr:VRR-NUC domain-containing protein [Reinekea marinisedimentorum]